MNVYVDSSVALRLILGEPDPLPEWHVFERYAASALLRVECFRAMDRLRFARPRLAVAAIERFPALHDFFRRVDLVALNGTVLDRAAASFPLPLKTLDAIHLATALLLRDWEDSNLVFATHDRVLAMAARALEFRVTGV